MGHEMGHGMGHGMGHDMDHGVGSRVAGEGHPLAAQGAALRVAPEEEAHLAKVGFGPDGHRVGVRAQRVRPTGMSGWRFYGGREDKGGGLAGIGWA